MEENKTVLISGEAHQIVKSFCDIHKNAKVGDVVSKAIIWAIPLLRKEYEINTKLFTYHYARYGDKKDFTVKASSRLLADSKISVACPEALDNLIEVEIKEN